MPLIRTGLPSLPGALSLWALAYLDRLLLPAFAIPLDQRGLYAIAAKLASMLAILTVPFQSAWGPLALAMRDDPQAERTYARVLTLFTGWSLWLALGLGLFAAEILQIFTTSAYLGAAPYVGILAYVAIANGASVAAGVGAALKQRTSIVGLATLVGALVNLALNLMLIPRYGIWGAAWATALGYAAMPLLTYRWAQRVHPLPYQPGRIIAALAAQILLLVGGLSMPLTGWANLGVRALLLASYPAFLLLIGILRPAEIRALLNRRAAEPRTENP